MNYSIGEMAELLGTAPSVLRYYEKEGLLPFVERSGGRRVFKDGDLEWLNIIGCLKKTGMPLGDIKHFIDMVVKGDETIGERLDMFERQREAVLAKIDELEEMLKIIDYKCWFYRTAKEAGTTAYAATLPENEMPEKFRSLKNKLQNSANKL